MNLAESIKFLESKGCKVYKRGNNCYSCWHPGQKNNSPDYRYTARKLIKLANSNKEHKSQGHRGAISIGPGGISCPCCCPPMAEVKRRTKRAERRNSLKDIDLDE